MLRRVFHQPGAATAPVPAAAPQRLAELLVYVNVNAPEIGVIWTAQTRTRNPVQVQEKEDEQGKDWEESGGLFSLGREDTCSTWHVRYPFRWVTASQLSVVAPTPRRSFSCLTVIRKEGLAFAKDTHGSQGRGVAVHGHEILAAARVVRHEVDVVV